MNPFVLTTAWHYGRKGLALLNDRRNRITREAYAALEDTATDLSQQLPEHATQARRSAGNITRSAHDRLEQTWARFAAEAGRELDGALSATGAAASRWRRSSAKAHKAATKAGNKARKRAQKRLNKQLDKAQARRGQSTGRRVGRFIALSAVIAALIAAVLAAVDYVLRRNDVPSEVPPRVEEFAGTQDNATATVVYSTSTETAARGEEEHPEGTEPLPHTEPETLVADLEEQLRRHQEELAAQEQDNPEDPQR